MKKTITSFAHKEQQTVIMTIFNEQSLLASVVLNKPISLMSILFFNASK